MRWLRRLFRRPVDESWDDTMLLPVIVADWPYEPDDWWLDGPDPYGWSAQRGWNYAEKYEWIRAGWDPTPVQPSIFAELDGDRVLSGCRPQLALEPAPQRELPAAPKRRTRRTNTIAQEVAS